MTLHTCARPSLELAARPDRVNDAFTDIDGTSPAIRTLTRHMRRVADDGDVTVLIVGESGTGKERIARAIHDHSPRHRSPFVIVNCAGLSPTLVEDELFGHVRGAFTGATHDRAGPFERAAGGTVFLDEVGELQPEMQMKLLRALQQRTVQRLGGRREAAFDVRVIAATNVDLEHARARGRFRADLYFRLKVYELRVPPLRRRGMEDVIGLAGVLVRKLANRRGRSEPSIDPAVLDLLVRYRWPGNVRELENTLERMIVAAGAERTLRVDHLPEDFGSIGATSGDRTQEPLSEADIVAALTAHGFNRRQTAAALGLSRHQLYRIASRSRTLVHVLAEHREAPRVRGHGS
jgi:transcriptional regulator with PAS, ATPase and Fis domain